MAKIVPHTRAFTILSLISPVIIGEVFFRLALRLARRLVVVRELVSVIFEKLQILREML